MAGYCVINQEEIIIDKIKNSIVFDSNIDISTILPVNVVLIRENK